jgi:ribosomal protein S18 acetylase RimI-like enzyme
MSGVVIRPATADDCDAVAAMVIALAALHDVRSGTTPDGLREAAFGARPTIEILVAEIGGRLVGYLIHQDTYSTWRGVNGLFVVDLFVDPALRGRRIGESLMAAAAKRGIEKDAHFMRLDIDADNDGGARFYQRLGFEERSHDRNRVAEEQTMRALAGK